MAKALQFLLGLAILAVLVAGVIGIAWVGIQWLAGVVGAGGPLGALATALVVTALTASITGVGYLLRSSREKRQQLETRLAESKRELYQGYVDVLKDVVSKTKTGKSGGVNAQVIERLRTFAFRSILISSDAVVWAHVRFTNLERVSPAENIPLPAIADVLLALRRDIGFADTKLTAHQILGVFISELDAEGLSGPFAEWEKAKPVWDQKMGWKA